MKMRVLAVALALCLVAAPTFAEKLKIGYITTLSGPSGVIGQHEKDATELALLQLGGKIGGLDTEVIYGDDQLKPDVGRQLAQEMIKKHNVDFVVGLIWSNVLLSVYQPVVQANKVLVSVSGGPHEIAGAMCSKNFFSTAKQNDQPPEAMGKYLTDHHVDGVFLLAPNFAAGRDMINGFKRFYRGRIVGEVYTRLDQTDYQNELSQIRAANPKAVFVFYAGGFGVQFIKQYAQAGLHGVIPLYSAASQDETVLPALGDAADGNHEAGLWSPALDNPANQRFVAAFREKFGYMPSIYAAEAYDAINLIDSAVKAVHGNLADHAALIKAMEKADFTSVRGSFSFNTNHFPIQNFYVFRIGKGEDGTYVNKVEALVFPNHKDAYYTECKMQ